MSRRRSNVRQYSAEDQALTAISTEAENRLAAKRAARAEAREIRTREMERKQKEEDEKERLGSDYVASRARQPGAGSRRGSDDSSEGTSDGKDRDLKKELRTIEEKYKTAMMTSAQLDNEKQSLVYQVELLKDQLEEQAETHTELQRENKDKHRDLELTKRELQAAQRELKALREQNDYKDRLIAESGLVIVAAENGELALERSKEAPSANGPVGTGGLLLSSESLTLLNKGREGSLGMHSLASSSCSATHTTQTASSTSQSQTPSQTHAEEPQPENQAQISSSVPVTTGEDLEGSSVDGPLPYIQASENTQTSVGSSQCLAGVVDKGGGVEAADALFAQSGAAGSHSPGDRLSPIFLQETGAVASDEIDVQHVPGEMKSNYDQVTSHEAMGSESSVDSTSDGMLITHLHGDESDHCKDKGWKESGYEDSQSNLPSVVVTECSHSQPIKSQDSEEEDGDEFFDAVSTPLPSPLETGFEFEEAGTDTEKNTVIVVAGTTMGETSTEGLVTEISLDSVQAEDVESEDFKEVCEEGEDNTEIHREDGREVQDKDDKEVSRKEEDFKETLGEIDKNVQVWDGEEITIGYEEHEAGDRVKEGELRKDEITARDSQVLEIDTVGADTDRADRNSDDKDDQQDVSCKDTVSDSVAPDEKAVEIDTETFTDNDKNQQKPLEADSVDEDKHGSDISDTALSQPVTDASLGGGAFVTASSDVETIGKTVEEGDDVCKEGNMGVESVCVDVCKDEGTETGDVGNELQDSQVPCFEGHSEEVKEGDDMKKEGDVEQGSVSEDIVQMDVCEEGERDSKVQMDVYEEGETESKVQMDMCEEGETESKMQMDVCEEGETESKVQMDVCEEGETEPKGGENTQCLDEKPEEHPEGIDKHDATGSEETPKVENGGELAPISSELETTCQAELDQSLPALTDPAIAQDSDLSKGIADESCLQLKGGEENDMKLKEMAGDESHADLLPDEDNGTKDSEEGDNSEKNKSFEKVGCQMEEEEKREEPEELPDTLSPMLGSRKRMDRKHSDGGTSEDSEARLNDDEYDFDDIDAVLDSGSPELQKGKDAESNLDADSDEKVSFGSKDSGLQESFTSKEYEANREDSVSFGSRDSGLQEKEGEAGFGDTVSVQSRDSGAGDTASLISQDSNIGKPTSSAEEGAVGGDASAKQAVAASRESLDLEAKLDQLVSGDSAAKDVLPKEKRHKKSKKFKMFKNIFK